MIYKIKNYMKKILLIQLCSLLLINNNSFAYFDPGTGSYILQVLAVVLASIATFFRFFLEKTKEIIRKIKSYFLSYKKK